MGQHATQITLTNRQRQQLEKWVGSKADSPYRLVERSRIILLAADGVKNQHIGDQLGVDRQRVRRWRARWASASARLLEAESKKASSRDYAALLLSILSDASGRGRKPVFTAEQIAQLIALACEPPEDSGFPVTHWTPKELATTAMERGIFESISPRHADRLIKGGNPTAQKQVLANIKGQA